MATLAGIPIGTSSAGEIALSSDQAVEVLELLKKSTSVELKVTVPYSDRTILRRLGFDPVDAMPRQSFFFDTRSLDLKKAGLFVRARRSPNGKADTTIKLRPANPAALDSNFIGDKNSKIEVDVLHGGYVCSASAKGCTTSAKVYDVSEGRVPLKSIFAPNQTKFFKAHAPSGVTMADLIPLGPAFLLCLKCQPTHFDRKMTVELWLYPDGSRILELSTKGLPQEAFQLGATFRAFLGKAKLMRHTEAKTKTSETLRLFAMHTDNGAGPASDN